MIRGLTLSQPAALIRRRFVAPPPSPLAACRFSSSSSSPPSDRGDSSDQTLRKLEDVIHLIIVRRSEPDWLPFRPGSSYWVPPRSNSRGIAKMIGKLASGKPHVNADETMSTATPNGWPSSSYFIHGIYPTPRPVEADRTSDEASQSEDGGDRTSNEASQSEDDGEE